MDGLTLWLEGTDLQIRVPSAAPGGRDHTVSLPLDTAWPVIRRMLLARRAAAPAERRIGHDAALTQAQCEALLRPRMAALDASAAERKAEALELLREAGML